MKEIIRQMLNKAYDEQDLDLANIASDLLGELIFTHDCPSDWQNILKELYNEFKDNVWIIDAVSLFTVDALIE